MIIKSRKVNAYQCPYCNLLSLNQKEIEEHSETCERNPNYTQICIECRLLNKDYTLTYIRDKSICLCTGIHGGGCHWINHDDTEVMKEITKSRNDYIKFRNWNMNISIEENWKRDELYDELRNAGYSQEDAIKEVYEVK